MPKHSIKLKALKPLKMTCTTPDCVNGMHCFIPNRKMKKEGKVGPCRCCGADPVDWKRVHKRNIRDVEFTVRSLQFERIRNEFWSKKFDPVALAYAKKKGKAELRLIAEHRIRKYLPPILNPKKTFDGRQTKTEGNPVFYAQHATGTCCRKCVLEWHGIPKEVDLSEDQIQYLSRLVQYFIEKRLPDLPEGGES